MANSSGPASAKFPATSSPSVSPATSQTGSSSTFDSAQRRSGGAGSYGAGSSSRSSGGQPRNKQASRNQHKHSRRYRLADEDAIAESAVMNSTNSRKGQTSITHLMNFSLPPRPVNNQPRPNFNRNIRRNPTWGIGSGYHAVDKARYVHANYRFIVDPRGDYKAQSVDADVYLDWGSILQVLASPISQSTSCPICLGDPVAPRMAKCGHIFCLHCLIRYMHAGEDTESLPQQKRPKWKSCPICWDSIYTSETKSVRWYNGQQQQVPQEGNDIVLRLVVRPAGSTLALPREGSSALDEGESIPWHFAADVMDFARVMKGTSDYMIAQLDKEIADIEQLERYDELMFGEDPEWTSRAMRAVKEAKERLQVIGNAPKPKRPEESRSKKKSQVSATKVVETLLDSHADEDDAHEVSENWQESTCSLPPTSEPEASPMARNPNEEEKGPVSALSMSIAQLRMGPSSTPSDYYFYQALLHYYLSPLDIRILKAAFGEFSSFPSTILPRVERISTGHVIDNELRKRTKYLAHLPHGCEIAFLECDWTDTVSPDILERFKSDIERRRKRNHEKETREEKDRVRAEKEEYDKRYAAARRKRPSSPENTFRPEDFQPLAAAMEPSEDVGTDGGLESTSPIWSSRKGNASAFASLASPSTSPNESRTVWGTVAIQPTSPELPAVAPEPNSADDGWLQGWEKDLLADSEVATQMEGASLAQEVGKSKKKKGKKITLMSTNAKRGTG